MRHHAFAAAMGLLTAALLAPSSQSQAASADPTGYWMKPDAERESKIQVFKCGQRKTLLCAKIIWLKEPNDSRGRPLHDVRNEDLSMRDRPIVGLTIFTGLAPSAPSTWTGKIYNPEDGHIYAATLTVVSRRQILLRGCKAWLLCGEKQWLRTAAPEELTPVVPADGTQQILGKNGRNCPERRGADDQQLGPPEQEGGQAAERLAQVHEHPAGARERRRQLGVGQRPAEGEGPAQHPHGEHRAGARHAVGDYGGSAEDPAPDRRADEHRDGRQEAEAARQTLAPGVRRAGGRLDRRRLGKHAQD